MSSTSYQARLDIYQKLRIDELEHDNAQLNIELHDANTEVGQLKLEVTRLENGEIELTAKLLDTSNEIGRLSMVIKHRDDGLGKVLLQKKK